MVLQNEIVNKTDSRCVIECRM